MKNATGTYTVTFTTAFSGSPAVTANASDGAILVPVSGATTTAVTIRTYTTAAALIDTAFLFIAVGPG